MKKQLMSAGVTNPQRKRIYRREGYRCALCEDTSGMQIHHIVPRKRGGTNLDENLICLCRFCHSLAHGVKLRDYCDMEPEGMEEIMAEYMAEYYINLGFIWNPWGNGVYKEHMEYDDETGMWIPF